MISHKHKCIFIHIPKTAGMSVYSFFYPGIKFHYANPDYERLFGWCPKRKIHMQHATSKQLLETELITQEQWNTYYKFCFVRNPWDRAYSDYKWINNFSGVNGSFKNYVNKTKEYEGILTDKTVNKYLGDHLLPQTDFFDFEGAYKLNFIGRFENFTNDIKRVMGDLSIDRTFDAFQNKSVRIKDYSKFYTNSQKQMVEEKFKRDIELLEYEFTDNRSGLFILKKYL
jgi:hypothetical protein